MLARLQKSMKEKDQGFTLIELLVVIVIIGILAAIAIPIFLNQRQKGVDAGVQSDLKQLATIQETYYTDSQSYTANSGKIMGLNFKKTSDNAIQVSVTSAGYCLRGSSAKGSRHGDTATGYYWYDSSAGGLNTAKTNPTGVCNGLADGDFTTVDITATPS